MAVRRFLIKLWCVSLIPYVVANSITFQTPQDCKKGDNFNQYFHIGRLECRDCSQEKQFQTVSSDGLSCVCERGFRLTKDNGGSDITCAPCGTNEVASADKWSCIKCDPAKSSYNPATGLCSSCTAKNIYVERLTDGTWFTIGGSNSRTCQECAAKTHPDVTGSRCERCTQILSVDKPTCDCVKVVGGICFKDSDTLLQESEVTYNINPLDSKKAAVKSYYFEQTLRAVDGMCRLYRNLTACQTLGNLCTLLHYYRDIVDKDACELFIDIMATGGKIKINLANFQYVFTPVTE